jgi:hypothetical protein
VWPCKEIVLRNGEAVYKAPEGCVPVDGYTRVTRLPAMEACGSGEGWRCERLETGEFYIQYNRVFDELDRCFSQRQRACKLLLYGPPGTGKSYAPLFFGRKWGRTVYVYSVGSILSKWVGETEERLSAALRRAEEEDAVVVLDEADVFMTERGAGEAKLFTVNLLLTELQRLTRGVVIATTNVNPARLDQALLRGGRLKPVAVPLPNKEMLQLYAKLAGREAPARAQSFPDVVDPRERSRTEWYYLLHDLGVKTDMYYIDAERGIYSFTLAPVEAAITLIWFYYAPRRQVWWIRKRQQSYEYVIDMADEYKAVVYVDPVVVQDFIVYLRPVEQALIVLPVGGFAPLPVKPLKSYYTIEGREVELAAELWRRAKPSCSGEPIAVLKRAFWGGC